MSLSRQARRWRVGDSLAWSRHYGAEGDGADGSGEGISDEERSEPRGVLAVLGALSLAGCASPTAIEDFPGLPLVPVAAGRGCRGQRGREGEEAEPELEELDVPAGETSAAYLDHGDRLAVVTWGSSSCPLVGTDIVVLEDANSGNAVRVELEEIPEDAICTADIAPHTTVFGTPENTTTTQPLARRGRRRGDRRPRQVAQAVVARARVLEPSSGSRRLIAPGSADVERRRRPSLL